MLYESKTLELSCEGAIASLVLNGTKIDELHHCLDLIRKNPFLEILVIRGAHSRAFDGFDPACELFGNPDANNRRFLKEFETLPVVSLAVLTGPCRGGGLELALACDYRIATATPDAWYELGKGTRCGGVGRYFSLTGRLPNRPLTAREARRCGLIDHAYSERRERIELRTWLDYLQRSPRKRKPSWWRSLIRRRIDLQEQKSIHDDSYTVQSYVPKLSQPVSMICAGLELRNCPQAVPMALSYLLHGGTICVDEPDVVQAELGELARRGQFTPLEFEKIQKRILPPGSKLMPWVFTGTANDPLSIISVSISPFSQPIRMGFSPLPGNPSVEMTQGPAGKRLAQLLEATGYVPIEFPDQKDLCVRPLLAQFWDEAVRMVAEGYPIDLIDEVSASITQYPPLRTLDRLGMDCVMGYVPRVRVFAEAGLRSVFYHPDRPQEPNSLAQAMLGFGPRMSIDEDQNVEPSLDELQNQIMQRFNSVLKDLDDKKLRIAGFVKPQPTSVPEPTPIRRAA